jgi:uncharacterized protein (TIGR02001 family)
MLRYVLALLAFVKFCIGPASAEEGAQRWPAPFGGSFNATFTLTTDYSYAGISNNARQPAFQPSLDYRTPDLLSDPELWLYAGVWGSNAALPAGTGAEIDLSSGVKMKLTPALKLDLGYVRVTYPGFSPDLGYDYGDFSVNADYEWRGAVLNGRLRFSPNAFSNSGWEFNKRLLLTVPLDFLKLPDVVEVKAYGSVGNLSVQRYLQYGIPSPSYWYWQFGVVTSAFGLDLTVAYTDTDIEPSGCSNTNYCAARIFASISKKF